MAGSSPAGVLQRAGWARAVGGSTPYVSLFARSGCPREETETGHASQEIHVLPSARGCTYLLPREHFAWGLAMGAGTSEEAAQNTAFRFLGYTPDELARQSEGVLQALADGPLDPAALKKKMGDLVRSFGDEGKKRGQATSLSLSLGELQSRGQIRRVPDNGRLDTEKYSYSLWPDAPSLPSRDEALVMAARAYWGWLGIARMSEFAWFAGLSGKGAREAAVGLGLVEVEDDFLALPEDASEYRSFVPSDEPSVALVMGLDSLFLLRRVTSDFLGAEHLDLPQRLGKPLFSSGALSDLECGAILDRGRIIGLWDYDPSDSRLVHHLLAPPTPPVSEAISRTESFIQTQLQDTRTSSLDSPKARQPRLEAIKGL